MGSLLETTMNTRDLGGYLCSDGRVTKKEVILRSDKQNYPSCKDVDYLLNHKITTIIDMRSEEDISESPSGFSNLDGFEYHNIPIIEGSNIPDSVEEVPYSYMKIAESPNIGKVFKAISEAPLGVMINCSAGKDRTGVVSAVLLLLCGVKTEDIISDYMKTKENIKKRFELLHERMPEIDMNIVIPRESFMYDFLCLFKEKWNDPKNYLRKIGLKENEINMIVGKLLDTI